MGVFSSDVLLGQFNFQKFLLFLYIGLSSYKSEQQLIIALRPDQVTSMLQSATTEILQVIETDRFENRETIKGHILSKLTDFKDTLLSEGVAYPSSEAVKLLSFKGAQVKSEALDPTSTAVHSQVVKGLSITSTEKGHQRKKRSLESIQHKYRSSVGTKRTRSNLDSEGQPIPKLERKTSKKVKIITYGSTVAVGDESVQSTTLTTEDGDPKKLISESVDSKSPSTPMALNTPSTSISAYASGRTKLLLKPVPEQYTAKDLSQPMQVSSGPSSQRKEVDSMSAALKSYGKSCVIHVHSYMHISIVTFYTVYTVSRVYNTLDSVMYMYIILYNVHSHSNFRHPDQYLDA